jgi:hypothetical protein
MLPTAEKGIFKSALRSFGKNMPLNLPTIGVMMARFVSAAEMMARVLSMPNYRFVVIGQPISSAFDAQLAECPRATVDQARRLLVLT